MAKSWRWKSSFNGWRRNSNVGDGVLRNRLPEVMDQEQTLYVCFVAFELKPISEEWSRSFGSDDNILKSLEGLIS
jgi:hypothetical protein